MPINKLSSLKNYTFKKYVWRHVKNISGIPIFSFINLETEIWLYRFCRNIDFEKKNRYMYLDVCCIYIFYWCLISFEIFFVSSFNKLDWRYIRSISFYIVWKMMLKILLTHIFSNCIEEFQSLLRMFILFSFLHFFCTIKEMVISLTKTLI